MRRLGIYNAHHYRSLWLFAVSCLNFSWTLSLCDYKVSRPAAQYFSLCSRMSTEWLISSGRDKRLVSMATTYTRINIAAVCADKAWHYVLLSRGLSTHGRPWGLHKHRKCTWAESAGENSLWSAELTYDSKSKVLKAGRASDLLAKQKCILYPMSSLHWNFIHHWL